MHRSARRVVVGLVFGAVELSPDISDPLAQVVYRRVVLLGGGSTLPPKVPVG